MSRTLYIGDIHGCADELERIIDAFGFVRGKDTLYQTGDIINKGPDMMRALGYEIRDLKRISYCKIRLGDLPAGEYRELTPDEMNKLRQAVGL